MSGYTKQIWADGDATKPLSAARLGHLEDGVGNALAKWLPNTDYGLNEVILSPAGVLVQAKVAFTSGLTFDGSNWNVLVALASDLTARALQTDLAAEIIRATNVESTKVSNTRTVNGKALLADVTLAPADLGAATTTQGGKADTAVQPSALTAAVAAETTRAQGVEAVKADLVGGVIPTGQIPALALTTVTVVATAAARRAQTGAQVQPGDVTVQSSTNQTFMLIAADPSVDGNWTELTAIGKVQTVNGQQGAVVLGYADVGAKSAAWVPASTDISDATALGRSLLTAANAAAVRTLLALGTSATRDVGTAAGTVAAGDDARIVGAAPSATTTIDLVDVTVSGAAPQLALGVTSNVAAGSASTSPTVPASVATPPARYAVKAPSTGSATHTFVNSTGATETIPLLAGEVVTFRQKNTSGYGSESGNKPLTQLDARYVPMAPSGAAVGAVPTKKSDGTTAYAVPPAALGASFLASTGDATDRYADIMAAITALGAVGGIVKFGPGGFATSQSIVVPGGVRLQGQSLDLGVDNVSPACGSWIYAAANFVVDTTSPVVQLGQDATAFASGADGASADYMIFDAAGVAAIAVKTFGRRTFMTNCQAWRGTVTSLLVAGQNSYVIDCWSSGNNVARPMLVSGSDSKIIRNQIRQAGPNLPQCEITGLNVEFGQNHVYGGANGTVAGTGPSDNLLIRCPAQTDVGHWRINDNTFDGTNGNHIHVIVAGAGRARDILINGNTFYSVTGIQVATYYPLKVDVTQCTFTFSIRELVFTNNTVNGVVATQYYRALVGFYGKTSPAAVVERFLVDGNMGSNAPLFTEGYTMRIDASSGTTAGSATVTDAAIVAADAGMPVTGPGIPPNTFVGPAASITAGTSFKLSSSPTSQVDVLATTTGTVSVNVGVLNSAWRPDFLGENNGFYINNATSTRTGNRGSTSFNGTGSATSFTITHGLGFTPTWVEVTPGSAAAVGAYVSAVSATTITVTYATAPASGTANVVLYWRAAL